MSCCKSPEKQNSIFGAKIWKQHSKGFQLCKCPKVTEWSKSLQKKCLQNTIKTSWIPPYQTLKTHQLNLYFLSLLEILLCLGAPDSCLPLTFRHNGGHWQRARGQVPGRLPGFVQCRAWHPHGDVTISMLDTKQPDHLCLAVEVMVALCEMHGTFQPYKHSGECKTHSTPDLNCLWQLISSCIMKHLGSSQGQTAGEIASGEGEGKSQGEYECIYKDQNNSFPALW